MQFKETNTRYIDTVDGLVRATCCYDTDNCETFVEFHVKTGYDDESDPYTYACKTDNLDGFNNMTDEQLEELYYNYSRDYSRI